MFNYYETYRTEPIGGGSGLRFPNLRGASNVAKNAWLFYGGADAWKVFTPTFYIAKSVVSPDGTITAEVFDGTPNSKVRFGLQFIPVTVEWMREHPLDYDLSDAVLLQLDQPGMKELLTTGRIPESYAHDFGPPEENED